MATAMEKAKTTAELSQPHPDFSMHLRQERTTRQFGDHMREPGKIQIHWYHDGRYTSHVLVRVLACALVLKLSYHTLYILFV